MLKWVKFREVDIGQRFKQGSRDTRWAVKIRPHGRIRPRNKSANAELDRMVRFHIPDDRLVLVDDDG